MSSPNFGAAWGVIYQKECISRSQMGLPVSIRAPPLYEKTRLIGF
jgi:hypothetical protein